MRFSLLPAVLTAVSLLSAMAEAQRKRPVAPRPLSPPAAKIREIGSTAVVVDETLSVLRQRPSLFAEPIQRMRRGRKVQILGASEADGVKFYKVSAPPANFGWVQADSVFGRFRANDEERMARLIQAADGFDQVELASMFFEMFPQSKYAANILLLYGDLLEEASVKLSRDAGSRLSRREMAASAAPMHSYFLNFVSLDRYRKLGAVFLFNASTRTFHYNGASWREITERFPASQEALEAQKRLDSLKQKMQQTAAK